MKRLLALLLVVVLCMAAPAALADLFDGMRYCTPGVYIAGLDMEPGEYVALATSEYGGWFKVGTHFNGEEVDEITYMEVFNSNSIFTVYDGEYVELGNAVAVHSDDFYTQYTIKPTGDGVMLRVGYDIAPGTYRLRNNHEYDGYYAIYNTSRTETKNIVDNENFDGDVVITLTRGQYVMLSRCEIVD